MQNKLIILCISLLLSLQLCLLGQSSVVVIVDVSGSGPDLQIKNEAKEITRQLILGTYSQRPDWKWYNESSPISEIVQGNIIPLIDPSKDGYLMIMPCGNKNRYKDYKVTKVNQLPGDLNLFLDQSYPNVFNDQRTYIKIAQAKAASLAKGNSIGISSYYLIEVSDGLDDTKSGDPGYSQQEKDMLSTYGSDEAKHVKIGTLRYEAANNKNYQIVVRQVDIENSQVIVSQPDTNNVIKKQISLIRPNSTDKREPLELDGESLQVVWKCLGCPEGTEYTVTARHVGRDKKVKPITRRTTNTTISLPIEEGGTYQVSVSGASVRGKASYVKMGSSGGGGGFFLLLLLLLAGAGAYYYFFVRGGGGFSSAAVSSENDDAPPVGRRRRRRPERSPGTSSDDSDDLIF